MSARFERRFAGASNAGLRAAIRDAVTGADSGAVAAQRVLSLSRTVALTASGRTTLEAVAADYAAVVRS